MAIDLASLPYILNFVVYDFYNIWDQVRLLSALLKTYSQWNYISDIEMAFMKDFGAFLNTFFVILWHEQKIALHLIMNIFAINFYLVIFCIFYTII